MPGILTSAGVFGVCSMAWLPALSARSRTRGSCHSVARPVATRRASAPAHFAMLLGTLEPPGWALGGCLVGVVGGLLPQSPPFRGAGACWLVPALSTFPHPRACGFGCLWLIFEVPRRVLPFRHAFVHAHAELVAFGFSSAGLRFPRASSRLALAVCAWRRGYWVRCLRFPGGGPTASAVRGSARPFRRVRPCARIR
jgi:hypothetical protein